LSVAEEHSAALLEQIGVAERLLEQRQLREAVRAFDVAEQMGADQDGCSAGRWMGAMLLGDLEAAWCESDAIRQRGGIDPHRFWMGENVRGKRVIVRCLHGFGDAIQFLRYLPRLQALAGHVIVEVPPRMLSLAPLLDGVDEVITWGLEASTQAPVWDVQIEVMELPYLFRTAQSDLPGSREYLKVPARDVDAAAKEMGPARRPRVGLVWAAGEWNVERSIPLGSLEPLVLADRAEFWSLQGGGAAEDAAQWVSAGLIRDAAVCGDGLKVLAAVIANLDLVITIDTLAAHMAGAMGKPTWILLQHAADWRWMAERCDTPWYPNTRLFRQSIKGDWNGVVERIRTELVRQSFPCSADGVTT